MRWVKQHGLGKSSIGLDLRNNGHSTAEHLGRGEGSQLVVFDDQRSTMNINWNVPRNGQVLEPGLQSPCSRRIAVRL